jgi:hypothetical protein
MWNHFLKQWALRAVVCGHSKIGELCFTRWSQEYVRRFDISMDELFSMNVMQRLADLYEHCASSLPSNLPFQLNQLM